MSESSKMIELAILVATMAHEGQVDKGGEPYILHPLRLMMQFDDPELKQIAVLHDVVEDTVITLDIIRTKGFSSRVIYALNCLTRKDADDYDCYILRVLGNIDSCLIKIKDIEDNLQILRLESLASNDWHRICKYHAAHKRIFEHLGRGTSKCTINGREYRSSKGES